MAVSVAIIPFSKSLDMIGEPDRHAAYSLSGHVQIALSPHTSFFDRRRTVAILLQSLVVTFEGQAELVTEETGYSAFRLCSVSQQLVDSDPIEMNNEGHEDSAEPCTWNVVFNLTIPGWLPETTVIGDREGGIRYALHASATVQDIADGASRSWFSTFCSPFRSPIRPVKAQKLNIQLNRFATSSVTASTSTSLWPLAHYSVTPEVPHSTEEGSFPSDVLSKLQVQASIPDRVGTEEGTLPLVLRLRTKGLLESECKRVRVTDFDIDIEQCERYRTMPLPAFTSQFPVPRGPDQPPSLPLLDPHPVQTLYDIGLAQTRTTHHMFSKTFSLLPENASGHYNIAGDGYAFSGDADEARANSWFALQTIVPFAENLLPKTDEDSWKNRRLLRPSNQSPFLSISHRMYVTLTCTYDLSEGDHSERATERIRFQLPVRFVRALPDTHSPSRPPSPTVLGHSPSSSVCSAMTACSVDLPSRRSPYAHSLPAYSQLFYTNGDRKIDYSIPLPLYTARPSATDLLVLGKCPLVPADSVASPTSF